MELKLPSKYDVVIHLFSKATQPESGKMASEITNYSKTLIDLWCKSFGAGYNLSLTAVKARMKKLVKEFHKDVYVKGHQKKKKHDEKCTCITCSSGRTSQRHLEKTWKVKNNELFDIGCNMDTLEGDEKLFYKDKKTQKLGRLDKKNIDEQYEQELLRQAEQEELQRDQLEEDFIMQPLDDIEQDEEEEEDEDSTNSTMNNTLDRSSSFNRLVWFSSFLNQCIFLVPRRRGRDL